MSATGNTRPNRIGAVHAERVPRSLDAARSLLESVPLALDAARPEHGEILARARGFCARILGWSGEHAVAVENALRSIHLSLTHCAALVLLGEGDLVPIAQALHRRTIGAEHPFVVCDRRRVNTRASARSPMNYESGMAAVRAARGGTLCVLRARVPRDFSSVVALVRDPAASVQLIVCEDERHAMDPFLALPAPIRVPSLKARVSELPRVVDEYALDAIGTLGAGDAGFTDADRTWVLEHAASTLSEIEKATLRLVALRMAGTLRGAAERLGMTWVALGQWFGRRQLPAARRRLCAATSDQGGR